MTYEIQADRNGKWRTVGTSDLRFAAEAAATVKADTETKVRVVEIDTRTVVFEVFGGVE